MNHSGVGVQGQKAGPCLTVGHLTWACFHPCRTPRKGSRKGLVPALEVKAALPKGSVLQEPGSLDETRRDKRPAHPPEEPSQSAICS